MRSGRSTVTVTVALFTLVVAAACNAAPAPAGSPKSSASAAAPVTPAATIATTTPTTAPPTVAPVASPSAPLASALAPIPGELQFRWIGPLRDVPQITPQVDFTGLEMGARTTWYYPYTQGDGPDLRSTTSSPGANELAFVTVADGAGCHQNDMGTYKYALDESKTRLTLTPTADSCQARSAAFSGNWTRSDCPDPRGWCLGALASGAHKSAVFTPFTPATSWKYDYGEVSYTVPTGWSNPEDTPGGYVLAQSNAPEFTAVYMFADVLAHSQAADCPEAVDPTVGKSAAKLTDWLSSLPSVATTQPSPVSIGGLSGSTIDVSVDPTWTRTCPYSEGKPAAPLFTDADPGTDFDWGVGGDGRMRLFLLALPNDRTLLIDIESSDKQTWDAFLPQAMPIVESLTFTQ